MFCCSFTMTSMTCQCRHNVSQWDTVSSNGSPQYKKNFSPLLYVILIPYFYTKGDVTLFHMILLTDNLPFHCSSTISFMLVFSLSMPPHQKCIWCVGFNVNGKWHSCVYICSWKMRVVGYSTVNEDQLSSWHH